MKKYLNSKLILFKRLLAKNNYIISDQSNKQFKILKVISRKRHLKLLNITKINSQIKNISGLLPGSFQKKNLSMAFLAAELCGFKNNKINGTLQKIKSINGRLELIKNYPNNIKVFIDYAHTPDALSEVIKSVKYIYGNNITLVFGCGGERDLKKRFLMAKIAKLHCKKIFVTDDNPRSEDPIKIRKDIIKNLTGTNYFNIGNRSKAIKEAILKAEPNEVILITGKGHENYQDYGKKIISISDKQIIKNLHIIKTRINKKNQSYNFNSKITNQIINQNQIYKFDGFVADSRNIKKNNLFLAIKGKNNDGNKFIPDAIKRGAKLIVSSKINKKHKNKILKVKNEIVFLNKFATLKRKNCNAKIIAITGSAGKTSLKNLLYNLLKNFDNTYSSPRSFNNHFGVPLSLSNLDASHKYGVFEVGMSNAGEINELSKMIKPNVGIITNIGEAHIENFNDVRGIAKEKSEIINNIVNKGTIILNRDDKFFNYLNKAAVKKNINVISFGESKKADVSLIKVKKFGEFRKITVRIKSETVSFEVKNINLHNVLCSLTVLKFFDLDFDKILPLFKNYEPFEGRGKIHNIRRYKKSFRLIDESYNANPLSVRNALNNFSAIKKNKFKKYLLLGDMLELGKKSEVYHKNLSKLINNSDIDKVFVTGEKTLFTYKNLKKKKRGNIFQCDQDIDLTLRNIITNNDYLMIKGSNATGLNAISKSMIKGF